MQETRVSFDTNLGSFVVAVDGKSAPKTAENFLAYVSSGHYDGAIFHRVIPGFMVQGGGYDASFVKRNTRAPVQNEADNGLKNARGTVAMARTGDPHSATAQFFVNLADNAFLDHKEKSPQGWGYTVFGRVVEGMDVIDRIAASPTGPKGPFDKDAPKSDVVISKARVVG